MQIRKAKINDIEEMYPLFLKLKSELTKYEINTLKKYRKQKKTPKQIKSTLSKKISSKKNLFLVAVDNNQIEGFLYRALRTRDHPVYKNLLFGELKHVFIKKSERHHHIMSALKSEIFNFFKKNKCKYIEVEVFNKNPAKKVYSHWGFKPDLEIMRINL